jgi:hypothetical protein
MRPVVPLPAPDDLPERPWIAEIERRDRIRMAVVVALSSGVVGAFVGAVYLRRRKFRAQ